jgi:hypothetical protein
LPALPRRNPASDRNRIEIGKVDEYGLTIVRLDGRSWRDGLHIGFDSSNSRSLVEYAAVSRHDQTGPAAYLIQPDNFRR